GAGATGPSGRWSHAGERSVRGAERSGGTGGRRAGSRPVGSAERGLPAFRGGAAASQGLQSARGDGRRIGWCHGAGALRSLGRTPPVLLPVGGAIMPEVIQSGHEEHEAAPSIPLLASKGRPP